MEEILNRSLFAPLMFVDSTRNPSEELVNVDPRRWDSLVRESIELLDGASVRMVGFGQREPVEGSGYPLGGIGMLIGGGGPENIYVVELFKEFEDHTAILMSNEVSHVSELVTVMFGQSASFDRQFCVTKEDVLSVAFQFVLTGTIDVGRWRFTSGPRASVEKHQKIIQSWFG